MAAGELSVRTVVSTDDVLDSALRIADTEGLDALTIRRLGAVLDVAPMTLYRYFDSKEDLLDQIADRAVDRFEVPFITSGDWKKQVAAIMTAFRQLLLEHPSLVLLLTTRRVVSVGITRSIEATLSHLQGAGFTGPEAVRAYAGLFAYVLGFVAFEIPRSGPPDAQAENDRMVVNRLHDFAKTRQFPLVDSLADELAEMAHGDSFEYGLARLIDGLGDHVESARAEK